MDLYNRVKENSEKVKNAIISNPSAWKASLGYTHMASGYYGRTLSP
jgi:hypothetical protein